MKQRFSFPKKGNKYGAERVVYDGITFDSKLECERYVYLKSLEESGDIEDLQTHVTYELLPKQTRQEIKHLKTKDKVVERLVFQNVEFTPDFVYKKHGEVIAEDVKGSMFVVSRDFPLRRKMLYYTHGVYVYVVCKEKKQWAMH